MLHHPRCSADRVERCHSPQSHFKHTTLAQLLSPLRNLCCHAKSLDPPTELHILRDMLMHKYGREFSAAVMENRDGCVSERVRLSIRLPRA